MPDFEGLPDTRTSLFGLSDEGDEVWLIRGIAAKLYRCPGCHGEIEIGSEHLVAHYVRRIGGSDHHHWHRACAEELLLPVLRRLKRVRASEATQARLEARGRQRAARRAPPRKA